MHCGLPAFCNGGFPMKQIDGKYCFVFLFLMATADFLAGCAGNYGRIARDEKTNESFLEGEISREYNYFYTGPQSLPSAILKIEKEYELVSDLWIPFESPEENVGTSVENLQFYHENHGRYRPYGYRIVNCEGKIVGGWYSIWDWTAVKCLEGNKIDVFPPPLGKPYDGYDDSKGILKPIH
jgi:hypothetical protein